MTTTACPQGEALCFLKLLCNLSSCSKRKNKKSFYAQKQFNVGQGCLVEALCSDLFGNAASMRNVAKFWSLPTWTHVRAPDKRHGNFQLGMQVSSRPAGQTGGGGGREGDRDTTPAPRALWVTLAELKGNVIETQTCTCTRILWGSCPNVDSDPEGLPWGLRVWIFNKLPGLMRGPQTF